MKQIHEDAVNELGRYLNDQKVKEYRKFEQKVTQKYGKNFTTNSGNLKENDVKGFLKFKENHHWTSINRHVRKIDEKVLDGLYDLINGPEPIDKRIDEFRRNCKEVGRAAYSAMLLVSHPEEYVVWNEASEWSLKFLGIWLEGLQDNERAKKGLSEGEIYKILNNDLKKIAGELGCTLWDLDTILWRFKTDHSDSMSTVLEVLKDYTKEDLNKIFDPELKFYGQGTKHGGKWNRNGVIKLFGDKHYGIFAADDFGDSIDLKDGIFTWIEQKKMIKNSEDKMLKKMKNNDLILVLFYRFRGEQSKYAYIGQIIPDGEIPRREGNKLIKKMNFRIKLSDDYFTNFDNNPNPKIVDKIFNNDRDNLLENVNPQFIEHYGKTRLFQSKLREMALRYYGGNCLICGIDHAKLLIASHIKPVRESIDDAGKIKNTLVLCTLHDAMFDHGLITIDPGDNFKILVSNELKSSTNEKLRNEIEFLGNKNLELDKINNQETKEFLKYHKEKIFIS